MVILKEKGFELEENEVINTWQRSSKATLTDKWEPLLSTHYMLVFNKCSLLILRPTLQTRGIVPFYRWRN